MATMTADDYANLVDEYAREIGISEQMIAAVLRPLALEIFQERLNNLDLPCVTTLTKTTAHLEKVQKLMDLLNSDLGSPSVVRNTRSILANEIKKYWCGHTNSNIGMQYLTFKDGIIHVRDGLFERTDLMMVQFWNVANVFVEADGSKTFNEWSKEKLSKQRRAQMCAIVDSHVTMAKDYMERERRFLREKPWLQLDGMTPEQAVAKLTELGWGPSDDADV